MKARTFWTSVALAITIVQWPMQVCADITALQAKELGRIAGAQMRGEAAVAQGYVIGVVEGCAQAHGSLRKNADSVLAAFGMNGTSIPSELGACLDKRRAPDEGICRSLIQQTKSLRSMDDVAAFFETSGVEAAQEMVDPCLEKLKKNVRTAMAAEAAMFDLAGIVEGCAQSHPFLRPNATAAYAELGMRENLSSVFGACLDKRYVPDESACRSLIQHAKLPESMEALSAFFDLPGARSAKKMVAACE